MSILVLQSSWWGRESWLLCLICLPDVSWWLSGSSSRCHGVVCSLWLWYFLIILTYFFWWFMFKSTMFQSCRYVSWVTPVPDTVPPVRLEPPTLDLKSSALALSHCAPLCLFILFPNKLGTDVNFKPKGFVVCWRPLRTFSTQIRLDKMSVRIWI